VNRIYESQNAKMHMSRGLARRSPLHTHTEVAGAHVEVSLSFTPGVQIVTGTRIRGRFARPLQGLLMRGRLWPTGTSMWLGIYGISRTILACGGDCVVARVVKAAVVWSRMRVLGRGSPLQHDTVSSEKYGAQSCSGGRHGSRWTGQSGAMWLVALQVISRW
jgi:hypothetical protein